MATAFEGNKSRKGAPDQSILIDGSEVILDNWVSMKEGVPRISFSFSRVNPSKKGESFRTLRATSVGDLGGVLSGLELLTRQLSTTKGVEESTQRYSGLVAEGLAELLSNLAGVVDREIASEPVSEGLFDLA